MNIRIDHSSKNQRLDRFIMKYFSEMKRTAVFKLIRKKKIRLNGLKASPETILLEGDQVWIDDYVIGEFEKKEGLSFKGTLHILYEDDKRLIVYKPKGLKTIPDHPEEISLTGLVQTYLRGLVTQTFSPSPVSRLDRNTTGLVLFGKTYESLKGLSEQMRERRIKKYYLALIFGTIEEEKRVEMTLSKDPDDNLVVQSDQGKKAITILRPLVSGTQKSLVEVDLVTGRSHQIRKALASLGHPIIGDPKYGRGGSGQLLTAYRLVVDELDVSYVSEEFIKSIEEHVDDDWSQHGSRPIREVSL